MNDLKYLMALLEINGLGVITLRKLLDQVPFPKQLFHLLKNEPEKLNSKGFSIPKKIHFQTNWDLITREIEFITKNQIHAISILDDGYPNRLKFCADAPILLYYKGTLPIDHPKTLAIVGTRNPSTYGLESTKKIISELQNDNIQIISGLAYGIDITAHRSCVNHGIENIAVLAHGLDRVYPLDHTQTAKQIMKNGGCLTEFRTQSNPDRENFPKRNRIVAGLADAILVIESKKKGGSMITANLGFGYARDVLALPGRVSDTLSEGCNQLIKLNKASLIRSASDIRNLLNWQPVSKSQPVQKKLFVDLDPEEELLLKYVAEHQPVSVDQICQNQQQPLSAISMNLISLELKGLLKNLPGKMVELA